jgi:hypothetical protein
MRNHFLVGACAIPLFLLAATPSLAQVDLDVDINPGVGVYGGYDDDDDDDYRRRRRGRLSCREARRIASDRYRIVETIECDGRVYTFMARRRSRLFEVKVNALTGAVWR